MFIKTSNPAFKDFGDIVYDDIDFSSSHKINLNNKFIDNISYKLEQCIGNAIISSIKQN